MRTLALVFALVSCALLLSGCATGRTVDGHGVAGFLIPGSDGFVGAAETVGGIVGTAVGGPFGGTLGTALFGAAATTAAGIFGLRRGERSGWDEAKRESLVTFTVPDAVGRARPGGGDIESLPRAASPPA